MNVEDSSVVEEGALASKAKTEPRSAGGEEVFSVRVDAQPSVVELWGPFVRYRDGAGSTANAQQYRIYVARQRRA